MTTRRGSMTGLLVVTMLVAAFLYTRAVYRLGVVHGLMDCVGVPARAPRAGTGHASAGAPGWVWGDAGHVMEHPLPPRPTVIRPADPRPWERLIGRTPARPGRDD